MNLRQIQEKLHFKADFHCIEVNCLSWTTEVSLIILNHFKLSQTDMWKKFLYEMTRDDDKADSYEGKTKDTLKNYASAYIASACANEMLILIRNLPHNKNVLEIYS
jgi:hypothetical protein